MKETDNNGCCVMNMLGILETRESNMETGWWTKGRKRSRKVGDSVDF